MKTLKFLYPLSLLLVALFVISCTKDSTPPPLVAVTGTVTYSNAAGTSANAPGAVVIMTNTTTSAVVTAVADKNGAYTFANASNASYTLTASWFTDNKNNVARMDGLTFKTLEPAAVTVAGANVTKDLSLTSAGQTGIPALDAKYSWTGTAYANTGAWTFDSPHSPVNFEFPYRNNDADFSGSFSQISKAIINFNPNNLAASSFDMEVDVASINTRVPGGRDNLTTVSDNPVWSPTTLFTKFGCIMGSFGITADGGTPSTSAPQLITTNPKRYSQFKSTSVAKLGDGFVAKGNFTFNGITKPVEIWFKVLPSWLDTSNNRTYSGFEGRFFMNLKSDFAITNSSVNDATIKIQISVVMYKL